MRSVIRQLVSSWLEAISGNEPAKSAHSDNAVSLQTNVLRNRAAYLLSPFAFSSARYSPHFLSFCSDRSWCRLRGERVHKAWLDSREDSVSRAFYEWSQRAGGAEVLIPFRGAERQAVGTTRDAAHLHLPAFGRTSLRCCSRHRELMSERVDPAMTQPHRREGVMLKACLRHDPNIHRAHVGFHGPSNREIRSEPFQPS